MFRKPNREVSDLVVVDPAKLEWHIRRLSYSRFQFAKEMDIGRSTLYRMLNGTPVRRSGVTALADRLEIDVTDLLPPTGVDAAEDAPKGVSPWHHPEWEIVPGTLMPYRSLSNGLVMRIAQVRHRVLPNELGRGKVFDIGGMPSTVRRQCQQALSRHATVCRQLRDCPQIANNLTMTASDDQSVWTCVDEWFSADTLEHVVTEQTLPLPQRHMLLRQVAQAIEALHEHQMIARELHPGRILVRDQSQAIVTDLEMAKLLEVEGSVSDYWQRNHYRAPEVASGESHPQADLYSFAHLYLFAATGQSPEQHKAPEALLSELLPAGRLREELEASLSPIWHERPRSITTIRELLHE